MRAIFVYTPEDTRSNYEWIKYQIIKDLHPEWDMRAVSYYAMPLDIRINTSPMWIMQTTRGKYIAYLKRETITEKIIEWIDGYNRHKDEIERYD